jgi:hypothetical protein
MIQKSIFIEDRYVVEGSNGYSKFELCSFADMVAAKVERNNCKNNHPINEYRVWDRERCEYVD